MSSWRLIQDVHSAITKDCPPPHPWGECILSLLKVLEDFRLGEKAERVVVDPSSLAERDPAVRDQMLVLLTVFINLMDLTKCGISARVPLQELAVALVKLITSQDDPYITNLATKCLCQCLASEPPQACDAEWYAPVLQPCLACLRAGDRLGPVIDLFRLLFSKRTMAAVGGGIHDIEKIRVWCAQEIIRLWRPLVEDVIVRGLPAAVTSDSGAVDPTLISLFSLWVKLIKTHHTHLASDLLMLDTQSFAPLQTTTIQLVDIVTRRRLPPVVFDKICDVLNRTLLYGLSTDQFQYGTGEGHGFSVDLGADVLRSVQMGLLDLVPLDAGMRDFMGCQLPITGGGKEVPQSGKPCQSINLRSVRKVALLVLKACAIITRSATYAGISLSAVELVLETLWEWSRQTVSPTDQHHWFIIVFGDQDDYLVEAMLCLLDIYTTIRWKYTTPVVDRSMGANRSSIGSQQLDQHGSDPHEIFLHFLGHTSMDHTVMLDLLTSPETCFLLYLVRYLHHAAHTWERLSEICLTWTPLLQDLEEKCTPRPATDSTSPTSDKERTPRISESSNSLVDEAQVEVSKCGVQEGRDDSTISNNSVMPKISDASAKSDVDPLVNVLKGGVSPVPPNVILTPPEEDTLKGFGTRSPIKAVEQTRLRSLAPKLVDYSDDSLSESEGEGGEDAVVEASHTTPALHPTNQLSADTESALDSAASDLGRSLTASLTSLTSVTSDLEMPSDLQDMGMDTDVEDGALDRVMAVLIRLRLVVERLDDRGLFPYNASALRRLLRQTEALYDGEED